MAPAVNRIAAYRERYGISQRAFARALREQLDRPVDPRTVAKWERDDSLVPADVLEILGRDTDQRTPPSAAVGSESDASGAPAGDAAGSAEDSTDDQPPVDDKAPRREPSTARPAAVPRKELERRIKTFYESVAWGLEFLNPMDAAAVRSVAGPAAEAWADLAQTNPQIARVWNLLTRPGGDWGRLALIHAPVVIAILANHQLLPQLNLFPASRSEPTHGQQPDPVHPVAGAAAAA